jgi:hypothetical protein
MKKNMPFKKDDYSRMLDTKLSPPAPVAGSLIDKVLQVAQTVKYTPPSN